MQTCSAALNSTATLVAYDLFKRYQPEISDHKLVRHWQNHDRHRDNPRHSLFAIVRLLPRTIFEGINKLISYVAPPITTVFVLGVFGNAPQARRLSSRSYRAWAWVW